MIKIRASYYQSQLAFIALPPSRGNSRPISPEYYHKEKVNVVALAKSLKRCWSGTSNLSQRLIHWVVRVDGMASGSPLVLHHIACMNFDFKIQLFR